MNLSIDRITMVLPLAGLSQSEDIGLFKGEKSQSLMDRLSDFNNLLYQIGIIGKDLGQTANYYCHYQLYDGVDFQFCPKRKKKKLKEKIILHGPTKPNQPSPLVERVYEYEDMDYALRFEWNPNKVKPVQTYEFILYLCRVYDCFKFHDLRINRLDVAIDYDVPINPQLFISDHDQYCTQGKRKKGLQTVYLGDQRSSHFYRIYNKKDEIYEKTNEWIEQEHYWRVELQINEKITPFEPVKNYFKKLQYLSNHDFFLDHLLDHQGKPISKDDKAQLRMLIDICLSSDKPLPQAMGTYFNHLASKDRKMRKFKAYFKQLTKVNIHAPSKVFDDQFQPVYNKLLNEICLAFYVLPDEADFVEIGQNVEDSLIDWEQVIETKVLA